MTHLAPPTFPVLFSAYPRSVAGVRKRPSVAAFSGSADEDGARKAMGTDLQLLSVAQAGLSIEHLARIALG